MWLECPTYVQPTRLPAVVASFVRSILHDRQFVVEIPEALRAPVRPAKAATPKRVTSRVSAARA